MSGKMERGLPVSAWAILENGRIALFDGRCPIYWMRRVARAEMDERGLVNADVVKVQVTVKVKR